MAIRTLRICWSLGLFSALLFPALPLAGRAQIDCAGPTFNLLPASGAAGNNVEISGITLAGRGCRRAQGLRILFIQGEKESELIRIDTAPDTSIKIDVKVPADAAPGMAQFLMEIRYAGDAIKLTRPFTVARPETPNK